jgi:hypothetical protein
MGIANHPGDSFDLSDLLGSSLRVTPGYHDLAGRVYAMDVANHLAHLGVCIGGHCASVQDGHAGLINTRDLLKACFA